MGNRTLETRTKLNNNGAEKQKKFTYDTNTLNQYTDRYISLDIPETPEQETETGEIVPEASMELI